MENPWDKMPQTRSASELNPLTNPLLERNLGRWARVYFSNAPARREQAVSRLLEEIKLESGPGTEAGPDLTNFSRHTKIEGTVCSACGHQNPPGHRFCSRCGKNMNAVKSDSTKSPAAPPVPEAQLTHSGNDTDNDEQWLRQNTFAGMEESGVPPRQIWKYLIAAAAIVLAGFAYLQWESGGRQGTARGTADQQLSTPAAVPAKNASPAEIRYPPSTISPEFRGLRVPDRFVETPNRTDAAKGLQSAAEKTALLDATSPRLTTAEKESGLSNLRLAQRYLAGSLGARDSSEAAKLLWKAVGKQNATAALLLSDLYLRGDGVPRSCAQAGILLAAAAKRGSAQAAQQLENLESRGCH